MLMPAIVQMRLTQEVILVGRSPGLDYLRPHVHACFDYEGRAWHRLFLERPDKGQGLPIPSVDLAIGFLQDPQGTVKSNLKTYLPSIPIYLFPPFPPEGRKVHVAFYLAECLQAAGCDIDPSKSLENACHRPPFQDEAPLITTKKRIVFHPGSGGEKKNHPPDFWLDLITALREPLFSQREAFTVLLGPAEDLLHSFYRKSLENKKVEVVSFPERDELFSLLKKASLYIGHDSGITHLAAMCGTPTIALFKGTSVFQWRPLGPEVRVIENKESSPSLVAEVLEAAGELFGKTTNHR
jgi:hypothetical protein